MKDKTTAILLISIFTIMIFSGVHSLAESSDIYIDEYKATARARKSWIGTEFNQASERNVFTSKG